jgi:nicotinate-nucleotide pyrophosphorylase (carboxylating)
VTNSLQEILIKALDEDTPVNDITSELLITKDSVVTAIIIAKENGIFFGVEIINEIFKLVDRSVKVRILKKDGDVVNNRDTIASFEGSIKTILKVERVLLNLLQRLSGVASTTNKYVNKVNNPKIKIMDTRKTTPLFRKWEKAAVVAGRGFNHRHSLSDMVLIKENHISGFLKKNSIDQLPALFKNFKKENPNIKIEIEIETIEQLENYNLEDVDFIMFDNFSKDQIITGLNVCKQKKYKAEIEVSGNVTLENISTYSDLDIDRISIGSLTHSVKALDLSLLINSDS